MYCPHCYQSNDFVGSEFIAIIAACSFCYRQVMVLPNPFFKGSKTKPLEVRRRELGLKVIQGGKG